MLAHRKFLAETTGTFGRQAAEKEQYTLWGIRSPPKCVCSCGGYRGALSHQRMFFFTGIRHGMWRDSWPICGAGDSWRHSLLECCVWALEKEEITKHICQIEGQDAKGWLATVMKSLNHEDLIRMTVTLWAIWNARRKVVHEDLYQSPISTHKFITNFAADLQSVKP